MSLLDPQPARNKTRNVLIAERLKTQPAIRFAQFINAWNADIKALWQSPDPQGVLDEIGPQAAELFLISSKTGMYLEALKPGCTAIAMGMIGEFKVNADGTVTILSIPAQGVILPIAPQGE